MLKKLHYVLSHPYTQLVVGVVLLISGVAETFETVEEDLDRLRLRDHHGILLYSLIHTLRAFTEIVEGATLIKDNTEG
ncbi:hypothetical protein [Acanthopleuribacter pedis]|uniref:Uncharacterized protein n=1 Tax=Acanthopleuribacter pedis TaxID=442870 RepID=A0A8J7QRQ0_9BACT|nr:hypothetical protein [Acanthopleuribacter pedis]MBO1323005.1 hypothetical protein [Acanthopleuribacter pedis]